MSDDNCVKVTEMLYEEKKNKATGGAIATCQQRQMAENVYQKRTEQLLSEENCFKIIVVCTVMLMTSLGQEKKN